MHEFVNAHTASQRRRRRRPARRANALKFTPLHAARLVLTHTSTRKAQINDRNSPQACVSCTQIAATIHSESHPMGGNIGAPRAAGDSTHTVSRLYPSSTTEWPKPQTLALEQRKSQWNYNNLVTASQEARKMRAKHAATVKRTLVNIALLSTLHNCVPASLSSEGVHSHLAV